MLDDQKPSRIDRLKSRLNRRGEYHPSSRRARFTRPHTDVSENWEVSEDSDGKDAPVSIKMFKKIFLASVSFFALVVVASIYIVLSGSNVISSDNLDLVISGPVSLGGGDEITLSVSITNNNPVPLEFVDMIVKYPEGARMSNNLEQGLTRSVKNLGTLASGETRNETLKAVLFGTANTDSVVQVIIEYRTQGSSAIFVKEKDYKVLISDSPLDVTLAVPKETSSGSEMTIELDLASNAPELLKDILAEVTYPSGFTFVESTPSPTYGNNVWDIGDLSSTRARSITITGVLSGQDNEKKLFRTRAGLERAGKEGIIGVPYGGVSSTVLIKRSFVDLAIAVNGRAGSESITGAGVKQSVVINWANHLTDKLLDGEIQIKFDPKVLDKRRVLTQRGFFNSSGNVITIDKRHDERLSVIEPGASGTVTFEFATLSTSEIAELNIENPTLTFDVIFSGIRVTQGEPGATIESSASHTTRINSKANLVSRAVHSVGPFLNTGLIPPAVGNETTYTILWSITNTSNELDETIVSGRLPSYVRWMGNYHSASENVRYDASSGEVVWNVGRVGAAPDGSPVKELAFQVAFLPSITQITTAPVLVENVRFEGRDRFTGALLVDSKANIDTEIVTDPLYDTNSGKVVNP